MPPSRKVVLQVREPWFEQLACLSCTVSRQPTTNLIQFCCAEVQIRADAVGPRFRADPAKNVLRILPH